MLKCWNSEIWKSWKCILLKASLTILLYTHPLASTFLSSYGIISETILKFIKYFIINLWWNIFRGSNNKLCDTKLNFFPQHFHFLILPFFMLSKCLHWKVLMPIYKKNSNTAFCIVCNVFLTLFRKFLWIGWKLIHHPASKLWSLPPKYPWIVRCTTEKVIVGDCLGPQITINELNGWKWIIFNYRSLMEFIPNHLSI